MSRSEITITRQNRVALDVFARLLNKSSSVILIKKTAGYLSFVAEHNGYDITVTYPIDDISSSDFEAFIDGRSIYKIFRQNGSYFLECCENCLLIYFGEDYYKLPVLDPIQFSYDRFDNIDLVDGPILSGRDAVALYFGVASGNGMGVLRYAHLYSSQGAAYAAATNNYTATRIVLGPVVDDFDLLIHRDILKVMYNFDYGSIFYNDKTGLVVYRADNIVLRMMGREYGYPSLDDFFEHVDGVSASFSITVKQIKQAMSRAMAINHDRKSQAISFQIRDSDMAVIMASSMEDGDSQSHIILQGKPLQGDRTVCCGSHRYNLGLIDGALKLFDDEVYIGFCAKDGLLIINQTADFSISADRCVYILPIIG